MVQYSHVGYAGLAGLGVLAVGFVVRKQFSKQKAPRGTKDTVVLRQLPRGPDAPSLSPFPLKLETYLRMANIPYENDFNSLMSSKSKTPWISYNEDDVADSQFSIEYLNKKMGIDLSSHLTPEERAIARAFQKLVEDDLYWCVVAERWKYGDTSYIAKAFGIPKFMMFMIIPQIDKMLHAQGMGRHSHQEVIQIGIQNLQALSDFIGNKAFLMGDKPCETDCTVFGMLCQFRWQMPNSAYEKYLKEKCPNLVGYLDRMKEKFWPDWDDCITHGGTKKATK